MSDITYEGDDTNNIVTNISVARGAPTGLLAWLISKGIVKDAKQGTAVLFGVAIAIFMLSAFILAYSSGMLDFSGNTETIPMGNP